MNLSQKQSIDQKLNRVEEPIKFIEVIGPAGAGKTTLGQILSCADHIKWIRTAPYFRRARDIPFFVMNTILSLPSLYLLYINKNGRWFTPEEIAWMVILNGWGRKLKRRAEVTGRVFLVDEGPIFHLAYLFMRGPEVLKTPCAQSWWQKMHRQVANTTDIIVWLDASNEVLLRRIRTRINSYLFDSLTDEQVHHFLDKLRSSYSQLVPGFVTQKSSLIVLMFDTEKVSADEISAQILKLTTNNPLLCVSYE